MGTFISDDEMAKLEGDAAPKKFISDDEMHALTGGDHSKGDSALRGAAQGISAGFGDELSGGAGYLAGKLGLVPDKGYDYYRDYARNQDKESKAANPNTYGASALGGGLASAALIPGAGSSLAGSIGAGAAQGGLAGLGSSDAPLLSKDTALNTLGGAALGGGAGALGYGAGQLLSKGTNALSNASERLGGALKGESPAMAPQSPFKKDIFNGGGEAVSADAPVKGLRDSLSKRVVEAGKDFASDMVPGFNTAKKIVSNFGPKSVVDAGQKISDRITDAGVKGLGFGMDKIGDVLKATPQVFGKFSGVLQQAAQRGPQGLAATHFILQQTNPEYQEQIKKLSSNGDHEDFAGADDAQMIGGVN